MLLEEASLNKGGEGDQEEAQGAKSLRNLVVGSHGILLSLLGTDLLLLHVLDPRSELVHCIFNKLRLLGFSNGSFLLLGMFREGLFHLLVELGEPLLHVLVDLLEVVIEIKLLEVSTSKINRSLSRSTSDVLLHGNLRIHFLEPNGLAVQEIVEEEEGSDAVEVSSESDVGVLLSPEPSGDSRSHHKAEHDEGEQEGNKSHLEEIVV